MTPYPEDYDEDDDYETEDRHDYIGEFEGNAPFIPGQDDAFDYYDSADDFDFDY